MNQSSRVFSALAAALHGGDAEGAVDDLGGALGAALLQRLFERRWAGPVAGSRVVAFTPPGERAFSTWLEGRPTSPV